MSEDIVFTVANNIALVGWLLLIFLPYKRVTRLLTGAGVIPFVLSIGYTVYLLAGLPDAEGGFGSLSGVFMLFQDRTVLLAGWIHYLAFDLFVGDWIVRDNRGKGVRHIFIVPILLATFMAGPLGYLLYALIRFYRMKRGVTNDKPMTI